MITAQNIVALTTILGKLSEEFQKRCQTTLKKINRHLYKHSIEAGHQILKGLQNYWKWISE